MNKFCLLDSVPEAALCSLRIPNIVAGIITINNIMVVFEMLDRERGSHGSCPEILQSLSFTALQIVSVRWEMISTISPVREAAVSSSEADLLRGIDQNNPCSMSHLAIFHARNAHSGHSLPH